MIPVTIYLIVPAAGLASFLWLGRRMRLAGIHDAPVLTWFWLYVVYGAVLLVALTEAFWEWSGAASLGVFFLAFGAPVILGIQAWGLRRRIGDSSYHRVGWLLSLAYALVVGVAVIAWISMWASSH